MSNFTFPLKLKMWWIKLKKKQNQSKSPQKNVTKWFKTKLKKKRSRQWRNANFWNSFPTVKKRKKRRKSKRLHPYMILLVFNGWENERIRWSFGLNMGLWFRWILMMTWKLAGVEKIEKRSFMKLSWNFGRRS